LNPLEKSRQRRQDALVPLTQECGQNVFADSLAPQVIATVAARVRGRVEVDPVILGSSHDAITAEADALTAESKTPLQSVEIDATGGIEVDLHFVCHVLLPIQAVVQVQWIYYTATPGRVRRIAVRERLSAPRSHFVALPSMTICPVGCGTPPAGSSVTAMARSESRASAYVARTIASPLVGVNVPALILAVGVTSHN